MLSTIIRKELKLLLLSPKFTATFAVCSLLLLLSVYVGINEYRSSIKQYETAAQLVNQEMREQASWMGLTNRVFRKPDPMQIFVSGVNHDIGRWSSINQFSTAKLRNSAYSDDPIFAVFRFLDFGFIVAVVFSLLALLFTYDAINGEREAGTLQLSFSNALPRAQFVIAKFIGAWLGLVLPLLIPLAMLVLMLFIFRIPMQSEHWVQLFILFASSLLYFTFFIALGLVCSATTRHSNTSFLFALVAWVIFVFVIPRAGVIVAGQLVPVPTVAEIEGQHDGYAKQRWKQLDTERDSRWRERETAMSGLSKDEREAYRDNHLWQWMEEEDQTRKSAQKEIDTYALKLQEDLRNRQATQQQLAFILARFSPSSAFQLITTNFAGTDLNLKSRYEDAMKIYRDLFNQFVDKKEKESGGAGGIRITVDTDQGVKFDVPRERGSLNLTDLPQFTEPGNALRNAFASSIIDFGMITLFSLLAFGVAFMAFVRYDVR